MHIVMRQLGKIVVFVLLLFWQCSKDKSDIITDGDGVITSQPHLWKVKLSESDIIGFLVETNVYYNDGVLIGAENKEGKEYLAFIDINNGGIKWKADFYDKSYFFLIQGAYQFNEILIESENGIVYNLNLNTGSYKWIKEIDNSSSDRITGIDSLFFLFKQVSYPSKPELIVDAAFYGNISDGVIKPLLIADLGDLPESDLLNIDYIGGLQFIHPFIDTNTDDIMLLCYYDKNCYLRNSNETESQAYLGLFNFSKKQWVYERVELGAGNWLAGITPTIIGDNFYHTLMGGINECRDLKTGSMVWHTENNFLYAYKGFVIADNKMIVMDDISGTLMALNIDNGNEMWQTNTAAGPSVRYELNGVLYFVAGDNGNLYAVDISNGEILWRIKDDYFKSEIKVIPGKEGEKGKIIVSSFTTYAYCYEAAR